MAAERDWSPVGSDLQSILSRCADPLGALARAEIPAIVLRGAYEPGHCSALIQRFIARGLMRDPRQEHSPQAPSRLNIGTSLGNMGSDREAFLQHAAGTHALFEQLFDGFDDPVANVYGNLAALAADKQVKVAREPDGRLYGPAIFRIHYETHAYKPHFDHVTLREKRFNYAVTRFDHQFAGVLCFQNADATGPSAQALLHRCLWTPQIHPYIEAQTFPQYAAAQQLQSCQVDLEPGDLYFFNTRCIHEVPPVQGGQPRIVLAVFIGYSQRDGEIFVWS